MKIALVSPYDWAVPGGVNSHVAHLAAQYAKKGHDPRIIAPASRPVEDEGARLTVVGRQVIGLPAAGSVAHVSLSFNIAGRVRNLLQKESFDVIHLQEPLMPLVPFVFLRHSTVPTVATFHAAREGGNRLYAYARFLIRPWVRNLSGHIAVSRTSLRLIGKYLPGRYRIIPNGVDTSFFGADSLPIPKYMDHKQNILFLGRLEKRKGLPYLLQAYAKVKQEMPQTRLIIVGGDGGMRAGCERYVQENGLSDVVFTGYIANGEVPRYYRTADIYCAPNTGAESQGIVLLEALAAGRPIVASNIEGFADVLTNSASGRLVTPRDSDALAEGLIRALSDHQFREAANIEGPALAQDYSWERISDRILDYYQEVVHSCTDTS